MNCNLKADATDPQIKRCSRLFCNQPPMRTLSPPNKCFVICRSPLAGIGNALAWLIDFATFSQGKKIADLFARKVLGKKGCGCAKRQSAMNAWGEKWLATLLGWWHAIQEVLNALGRKISGG